MNDGKQDQEQIELLLRLQQAEEATLSEIYQAQLPAFVRWAMYTQRLDANSARQLFQDTFVAMYLNLRSGKLSRLESSLHAYLVGIGKNLLSDQRKHRDNQHLSLDEVREPTCEAGPAFHDEQEYLQEKWKSWLRQLGEPGCTVLRMAFFEGLPNEVIADRLGYKGEHVVRVIRSRSLKRLGKIMRAGQQH